MFLDVDFLGMCGFKPQYIYANQKTKKKKKKEEEEEEEEEEAEEEKEEDPLELKKD